MATVRRDFFLDPVDRLTEQERALMLAMLGDFVAGLAAEIAAAANSGFAMPDLAPVTAALTSSGQLDRPGLVSLMLRRADEHRIAVAFAGPGGPRALPMLSRLVGDSDPAVAAAAMALVVARGRRRDGFGQPRIELSDLDPADVAPLVHAVAAALSPSGVAEARFAAAAANIATAACPADSLDQAVASLADALVRSDRDSERLIEDSSGEGEAALAAHLIARRSGITPQAAWDHLLDAGEGGLALLARMAGLSRKAAARLIADFGSTIGTASVEDEMARFDGLEDEEVAAQLAHWRLPRDFRIARTLLGYAHG
ncbi:DUF2336 domain-containing protein [Sphingomonas mesophila]|uniref:DUF2336 domain-containing protein n=1 Tax=Sphingomonas mesophila TaxID=2303576 RepID=UPI0013C357DC|nr:DUF2336 domain-containing protein [Sphingomonas mesophila]